MIIINNIKDIKKLVNINESALFNIHPNLLIYPFVLNSIKNNENFQFHYFFEHNKAMFIEVEEKVIIKIVFFKCNNKMEYKEFRDNDLPTILKFDKDLNKTYFIWKSENELKRANQLKPITISFNKDYNIFSYIRPEKSNIYPSYIIYNKIEDKIDDIIIRFYNKDLNIKNVQEEFPDIINATEEDCYDLSKKILTNDILKLKKIINY